MRVGAVALHGGFLTTWRAGTPEGPQLGEVLNQCQCNITTEQGSNGIIPIWHSLCVFVSHPTMSVSVSPAKNPRSSTDDVESNVTNV